MKSHWFVQLQQLALSSVLESLWKANGADLDKGCVNSSKQGVSGPLSFIEVFLS